MELDRNTALPLPGKPGLGRPPTAHLAEIREVAEGLRMVFRETEDRA